MASEEERQGYKQSFKASSLFGGVQVFNILINIFRSKIIAVFLGTEGMGIFGLFSSAIGLITSLTNFSLGVSAVKDIATAEAVGDIKHVSKIILVFRRLVWITGLLGFSVCLGLSEQWSKLTFGSDDYTVAFVILSLTLLFNQLSSGQIALLQGMRRYSSMAKSSVIGSTLGLLVTIPLYYYWRIDAVVPGIVISSFFSLLLSWYFSRKIQIEKVCLTLSETIFEGKNMVRMGFFIALQGLFSISASYVVRIFINNTGGIDDVGLFTAGITIVNTYVSLVFTAMGTEYYPRLAACCKDRAKFNVVINQQMEIGLLLLSPIIMLFVVFINIAITILYSRQFIGIDGLLYWAILGMFFKAPAWTIAFSFIAKGDSKTFFWNELIAVIYSTTLNLIFYKFMGLTGIGISFFIGYFIYCLQVWIVCRKRYHYRIDSHIWKIVIPNFVLAIICVVLIFFTIDIIRYSVGSVFVICSFIITYRKLNKRIGLTAMLKRKFDL